MKKTIRIDEGRLEASDIKAFQDVLQKDTAPLIELFSGYLKGLLNINNASIVPRWLAVLPIAAYLTERKRNNHSWHIRDLTACELQKIHQYFLLSQFCDWNTQTMVNSFAREAMEAGQAGNLFPLENIRNIAIDKNRTGELHEYQLLSQSWFATKVLMPSRSYIFHDRKPQVDHIFPIRLAGRDETYEMTVDVLWNFQPVRAEINLYKTNRHPGEFFRSEDGNRYWSSYDFIPEPQDALWGDHLAFVNDRKRKMLDALTTLYGLTLAVPAPAPE